MWFFIRLCDKGVFVELYSCTVHLKDMRYLFFQPVSPCVIPLSAASLSPLCTGEKPEVIFFSSL